MNTCKNKFLTISESGTLEPVTLALEQCYNLNSFNVEQTQIPNIFDQEENCTLVNTVKESKYTFIYNPIKFIERINEIKNKETREKIKKNFTDICDMEPKNNCCNCIAITLYYKSDVTIATAYAYLSSIYLSIKNVERYLEDWIIRIYIDIAVYSIIMNFIKNEENEENVQNKSSYKLLELYNEIINSDNVEIYTIACSSIIKDETKLGTTRINRFLPFIDEKVNISIIREADGIISCVDCYNIKKFSDSSELFYIIPFLNANIITSENKTAQYFSYSKWLRFYKNYIKKKFFDNHNNIIDLLAGTLGLNFKLKKEVWSNTINNLTNKINDIIKNLSGNSIHQYKFNERDIKTMLSVGFDEILLLDIFGNLISVEIEKKNIGVEYIVNSDIDYKNNLLELIVFDNNTNKSNNNFEVDTLQPFNDEVFTNIPIDENIIQNYLSFAKNKMEVILNVISSTFVFGSALKTNLRNYLSILLLKLSIFYKEHTYVKKYLDQYINYIMLYLTDVIVGNMALTLNTSKFIVSANHNSNFEDVKNGKAFFCDIFFLCNLGPYYMGTAPFVVKEIFDLINNLLYKNVLVDSTFINKLHEITLENKNVIGVMEGGKKINYKKKYLKYKSKYSKMRNEILNKHKK